MDTVRDFEDILDLLNRHQVRYLIIGGLAFIFHAKPRYTKDLDLWIDPSAENVERANRALADFGSPHVLDVNTPTEILQLGVALNRIDLLREAGSVDFDAAWRRRIESPYGRAQGCWIGIDDLIAVKSAIDDPRHQDDVRVLRKVRERRQP